MAQLNQNFIHFKGNDKEVNFVVQDVATVEGCKARWTMSEVAGGMAEITKSTEDTPAGITLVGKTIKVILKSEDTDDLSPVAAKKYYHECELEDTAGNISTVAIGEVDLREVTLRIT